jgi:hypothetical protein
VLLLLTRAFQGRIQGAQSVQLHVIPIRPELNVSAIALCDPTRNTIFPGAVHQLSSLLDTLSSRNIWKYTPIVEISSAGEANVVVSERGRKGFTMTDRSTHLAHRITAHLRESRDVVTVIGSRVRITARARNCCSCQTISEFKHPA